MILFVFSTSFSDVNDFTEAIALLRMLSYREQIISCSMMPQTCKKLHRSRAFCLFRIFLSAIGTIACWRNHSHTLNKTSSQSVQPFMSTNSGKWKLWNPDALSLWPLWLKETWLHVLLSWQSKHMLMLPNLYFMQTDDNHNGAACTLEIRKSRLFQSYAYWTLL